MEKELAKQLHDGVRQAYSDAAKNPDKTHPFPVGRAFALSLGYSPDLLDVLPPACYDVFAGVSNVSVFADIKEGATILDLGCGSGLDSLIAAQRVGPNGRVLGIDFSETMLDRAQKAADLSNLNNVIFFKSEADNLPVDDGLVDVVLVNGIFNLNPKRETIFQEMARVVRQGGSVYIAELVLKEFLPSKPPLNEKEWFA